MSILLKSYIDRVSHALDSANKKQTKLKKEHFEIEGMSSPKNRIFLNELIYPDTTYLEIGSYFGSTLISALYGNSPKKVFAIDNFSQGDSNFDVFQKNCKEHNINDFEFFNSDCFNMNPNDLVKIKDINTYFFDGDHNWKSHRKALTYYINSLTDSFIFIVDDWNWPHVQFGTYTALNELGILVHKSWELPAKFTGDLEEWWNGLFVAVCEKKNINNLNF